MVFSTAATAAYAIRIPFVANFYLQGSLNGNLGFNPISLSSSYSLALGSGVGGPVAYSITAGYAFYWGYDDACSVQGYSVIDFIDAVVGGLNFTFAMINAPKRSAYPPVHYTTGGMIGVGFDLGMDGIPLPGVGEVVSQTFMITFVGCCPDPEWIATD
jgi:hypothetical protein